MLSMAASRTAVGSPVTEMLSLACPSAGEPIAVLGPHALDLTLQLCRLGYDEVICSCRPGSPICTERSYLILIGGPVSSQALILLLRDASSLIGEEGAVVLQLADIDQDRLVEPMLLGRGLQVASTVFHLSGAPIVCHRVRRAHDVLDQLQEAA